jgi:hypothetical protein
MSLPRSIRTRLLESLWTEIVNWVAQSSIGLDALYGGPTDRRIYPFPLLPWESTAPRQINITPAPFLFQEDVGGVTDTTYDFEIDFLFPVNIAKFVAGGNSYLDDIDSLRTWLLVGGSANNKSGRLKDPDNPGQFLNNALVKWHEGHAAVTKTGNAALELPIIVGYETRENRAGVRT